MTQRKIPCTHYLKGRCNFGDECNFLHPGAQTSAKPNNNTNKTNTSIMQAKKKCNNFWETGECRHGFNCRYQHVDNPANKSRSAATHTDDWRTTSQKPGASSTLAIDATFPTYDTVNGRASDELLFPSKMLVTGKAKATVQDATREGKRVTTVAIAEELVLALNASNRLNEHWVSHASEAQLTIRPSRIGRACSRRSLK